MSQCVVKRESSDATPMEFHKHHSHIHASSIDRHLLCYSCFHPPRLFAQQQCDTVLMLSIKIGITCVMKLCVLQKRLYKSFFSPELCMRTVATSLKSKSRCTNAITWRKMFHIISWSRKLYATNILPALYIIRPYFLRLNIELVLKVVLIMK